MWEQDRWWGKQVAIQDASIRHVSVAIRTQACGVRGVVGATNKFTLTAEVQWRKGTAWPLSG